MISRSERYIRQALIHLGHIIITVAIFIALGTSCRFRGTARRVAFNKTLLVEAPCHSQL
jgi:hypothetical protein